MLKKVKWLVVILILLCFNCWAEESKETKPEPIDVVIKGKAKDTIEIEKPKPDIEVNLEEVVPTYIEKTNELLKKEIEVPTERDYALFYNLNTDQISQPYLPDIAEPPLISFYPKITNISCIKWELIVTDEKGNTVKVISGKGKPNKIIEWDGIDKKGNIIKVGALYSYRFISIDKNENPTTLIGKSFKLDSLKYKEKGKIYIEISNNFLFGKEAAHINKNAKLTLEKVCDILRKYSSYPNKIRIYTDENDASVTTNQISLIKNFISKHLPLLEDEVDINTYPIEKRGSITAFIIYLK